MYIYQKQINPSGSAKRVTLNNVTKIGIIIPERIYMKQLLSNEDKNGFPIELNNQTFYIGKTFIYETDQSLQESDITITFPQVEANWGEEDYINHVLRFILVDYVTREKEG